MAPDSFIDALCTGHVILSSFMPVSLNEPMITVAHLKCCLNPVDIMPPKFHCEVMDLTAPRLLSIINSLSSGYIPEYLKPACVKPSEKIQPQSESRTSTSV